MEGLETALGTPLTFDPPGRQRLGEAFEAQRAEIGQLEQPAYQTAGRLADHHAARCRQRLQAGREVGCVADYCPFARRALADQLADHHEPRGDADPRRQRLAARIAEMSDCRRDREPGPHRPLGLVLVRLRPAEIGQDAVAHVLGDMPAPAVDRLAAAALIGADHLPHVLRVKSRRQLGRAHQVDEHHRQLPPFRFGASMWRWLLGGGYAERLRSRSKRGDRVQQLFAMAERDPELLQVLLAEVRQDFEVDIVLGERPCVLRKPQILQPTLDVHHH